MKRRTFLKSIGTTSTTLPFAGCSILSDSKKYSNYKPKGMIPKRTLGKTGIEVSMLGFGSHLEKQLIARPEYRDRMVKLGFEGGINLFDVYNHRHNKLNFDYKQFEPMGKSIREFRKDVIVSLITLQETSKMQDEIDGALRDFHTDYIDLYRLITIDEERINIMVKSKKAGKIRAIGVVSHDAEQMMRYVDEYHDILDYAMIIYNFHHNKGRPGVLKNYPVNDYTALIPRCKSLGLGILGIKPMGSDDMIPFARKKGFFNDTRGNLPQALLRYVYEGHEINCTMPAMNSIQEVITNLESAYSPELSYSERMMLKDLSREADVLRGAYLSPQYRWLENWATKVV